MLFWSSESLRKVWNIQLVIFMVGWLKIWGKWYSKVWSKNGDGSFMRKGWYLQCYYQNRQCILLWQACPFKKTPLSGYFHSAKSLVCIELHNLDWSALWIIYLYYKGFILMVVCTLSIAITIKPIFLTPTSYYVLPGFWSNPTVVK